MTPEVQKKVEAPRTSRRKVRIGKVVSNKMQQSIVVSI